MMQPLSFGKKEKENWFGGPVGGGRTIIKREQKISFFWKKEVSSA